MMAIRSLAIPHRSSTTDYRVRNRQGPLAPTTGYCNHAEASVSREPIAKPAAMRAASAPSSHWLAVVRVRSVNRAAKVKVSVTAE
jgi:hypothetical protein